MLIGRQFSEGQEGGQVPETTSQSYIVLVKACSSVVVFVFCFLFFSKKKKKKQQFEDPKYKISTRQCERLLITQQSK